MRRIAEGEHALYYLSLFDDEIEARLEDFLSFKPSSSWTEATLAAAALRIEPTDAVVIARSDGEILVARGGACNFPLYWTTTSGSIWISTP